MTTRIPDPYSRTVCNGKPLDWATTIAIRLAERELGYELTILQGIGGATASAGTHLEGRAVDLSRWDEAAKVKALEAVGFVAFPRDDLPRVWSEHIHAVLMFESVTNSRGLAPAGFRQIAARLAGRDGLKGNRAEARGPLRNPHALTLEDYRKGYAMATAPKPTRVQKARNKIVEAMHLVGHAAINLENTDESRTVAHSQVDDLRAVRRELRVVLEKLPKK